MAKKKSPKIPASTAVPKPEKATVPTPVIAEPLTGYFGFIKTNWIKALSILVLTFGIYFASINYGYLLDDAIVIEDNNYTKKGFGGIWDIMTSESMEGYFGQQMNLVQGNRYRPLSLVSFALEYGITGGLNPGLSHFINVLLYAFSGVLLFFTFHFIMRHGPAWSTRFSDAEKGLIAFITALIFTAHPLHVEAVANIKGRDEIMAVLFAVWSLYFVYKDVVQPSKKSLILASVLFLLGLLSKENTITFLAVIPLTVWFFNGKKSLRAIPYLGATTILYLIWRFNVSGVPDLNAKITDIMNNPFLEMDSGEKFATIMYTLGQYIKLLVFPHPLTHDYYPYAIPIMNLAKPGAFLSLLLYLALAVFGVISLRKRQMPGYSIWFYLITLSIVSNLVINLGTFMNDRFVYMPSIAYCLLLAYGVVWAQKRWLKSENNILIYSIALLPVLAYTVRSVIRVPAWENAVTLNRSAFPASEGSARANSFLATALFEEARAEEDSDKKLALLNDAFPYALKAHQILPNYRNGNIMLAGIAAEKYGIDRNLQPLLDVFYEVCIHRPDIQTKTDASGKLSSFITEYLDYLNAREQNNPAYLAFYKKTLKAMSESRELPVRTYGPRIAEMASIIAPNDPEILQYKNAFR